MNNSSSIPDEIYFYSVSKPLIPPLKLRAGPLDLIYENGSLRYISLNGFEVVRIIYSAVRDHNWDTVEPQIKNEKISDNGNSFHLEYEAEYQQGEINFLSKYIISGSSEGIIDFSMDGNALSTFRKNRVGFCVLHPIKECIGKLCEITDEKGEKTEDQFPELISPHQPFKNIKSMRWPLLHKSFAEIQFEGDIFETEDQRNWTDASFKTYCTPLEKPFPVTIEKGTQIKQSVHLKLSGIAESKNFSKEAESEPIFTFSEENFNLKLPFIGLSRSSEVASLSSLDLEKISTLGLDHYRVEVKLFEKDWKKQFLEAVAESKKLMLPLEIALHLDEGHNQEALNAFINEFTHIGGSITSLILISKNSKTTPDELINNAVPLLRESFPTAKIGGGTDAYFAELNRNRPPTTNLDFLSYSINPQVHAFDLSSLTESLKAQGHTVLSAKSFASGKSIHVSPVTLKPRFNPNATGPEPVTPPGQLPSQVDVRQRSLFAAGWTLGSIKYLAEAGAESITYFETAGKRGLLFPENFQNDRKLFPAVEGEIFPMYGVFKELLKLKNSKVLLSKSNFPLQFDGMAFQQGNVKKVLLANYLNQNLKVKIPGLPGEKKLSQIDASILKDKKWIQNLIENPIEKGVEREFSVTLPPFGIVILEAKS